MAFSLRGIGQFFKGVFGENDEEKKRRLEQEAQAKAAQKSQPTLKVQTAQPQGKINVSVDNTPKPKITTVNQLFQSKPNVAVTTAPSQDLRVSDKVIKNTTSVRPLPQPKPQKDDFFQDVTDITSIPGRSILRVATGIGQGASGLYDLFTPGKGENRVSKSLNQVAKTLDESAKEAGIGTAYKALNVPTEIASYFIPSTLAGKVASKFPKGTKLTEEVVEAIAKNVDNAGDAGKVRRFLADRMRKGWTLDQAIEETLQSAKYTGENASKGNDTSPASVGTDIATAVGGSLLFPGNRIRRGKRPDTAVDEVVEDVVGTSLAATGEAAENRATREALQNAEEAVEDKGLRNVTDDELKTLADDETTTALNRKQAKDEIIRRADAAEQAVVDADPLNRPAYQHRQAIKNVVDTAETKMNDYLDRNPQLTPDEVAVVREATRKKTLQLVEQLQESRYAAIRAVDDQAAATGETVKAGQEAVEAAAKSRAAATTPAPADVVETPSAATSPEAAANDAYRPSLEEAVYSDAPTFNDRDNLVLSQRFSPERLVREKILRPAEKLANRSVAAAQTSGSRIARGVGRLFTGFNREAGVLPEQLTAKMRLRGGVETGKMMRETIADLSKEFDDEGLSRVWATLDPEHAGRLGVDAGQITLSPQETVLRDKLKNIIDSTTAENLRRGLITPEQAANDSYLKRAYTVYDGAPEGSRFERGFRQELLGQFKGRKQVSEEMLDEAIKDPTYLVGKKTAESNAIWAMQDYGNFLIKNGDASDVAKPGYTQLPDSPVFGDAGGKWVPQNVAEDFTGFQYTHAMTNAFNDLITGYDRLGIRQAKKQLLTIFNPAVRLGNQLTNRVIFAQLNGVNPLKFNRVYFQVGKMINQNHQLYREAVAQGLTGIDISQADFYANRIANSAGDKNIFKKALDYAKTSYSGADDKARITAYVIKRQQGYPPEEAARLVQRGFQDYRSVGFFYDLAAKTPVIGNAFVRFAADSVRIAKNAAIDHPLRTMSTLAVWSALTNGMSVLSGESELKGDNAAEQAFNLVTGKSKSENQKEREGRFGAPKIPLTDISTTIMTPWGAEVNVARFMPWYQLNDIQDTAAAKFLPLQNSPIRRGEEGGFELNPKGANDPLLGQVVQLGMDEDFRGKSISDPENTGDKFKLDPLSDEQKRNNLLRFLFAGNAPLGKEIDQTVAAYQGREDIYGKERTPAMAWLRNIGLKVEQQGDKQREKRTGMEQFQIEKAEIDRELKDMSPAAQEAYKRLTGYYKLRELTDNEFSPGDKRNVKAPVYNFGEDKWKEYAAHPELYNLMVDKKQREKAKDGKPIQPEFDPRLSEPFRRQLIQNKMVAPGDDAELDQRMYSSLEWDYYQQLKKQYSDEAKQYYPDTGSEQFDDETVKHQDAKFPEKPDILKQYGAAYARYADGKGNKPEFTDQLKAAKEAYNKQTLNWTNTERKARGLPPITWEMWNNPTFGYDETPSGFGFGFGGSKRDPADFINMLGRLTNFTGDVSRLNPIEAAAMPQLAQLFASLQAGSGAGRRKPTLGAGSRGL